MKKYLGAKAYLLRFLHGLFALYFMVCLAYLYYAALTGRFDGWLGLAVVSLGIEGVVVFVFNHGDCPLIYLQRRLGDDKPFFELFFSPAVAKQAIPLFAKLTWWAVGLLMLRAVIELTRS